MELRLPWPGPKDAPLADRLGERCSAILVNSGQWWAASKRKPHPPYEPRTPSSYAREVGSQMAHLAAISRKWSVPVAWLATNPFPMNAGGPNYMSSRARVYDMSACPPQERRFPHVLRGYNEAARLAAAEHGVTYLDTWEIALPLFDLSADSSHYAWGASPVARPQAARALNWVFSVLANRLPCVARQPSLS